MVHDKGDKRHVKMEYTTFFYKKSFYKNNLENLESPILILHQELSLFTVELLLFTMEVLQFRKICVRNQHTNRSKHS